LKHPYARISVRSTILAQATIITDNESFLNGFAARERRKAEMGCETYIALLRGMNADGNNKTDRKLFLIAPELIGAKGDAGF
jgi:hypothetical protein